jgi:hypothetical protein
LRISLHACDTINDIMFNFGVNSWVTPIKFQQNMCLFSCPKLNTKWAIHSTFNMTNFHPKHLCFKIACHKYGLVLLSKHENLIMFFAPKDMEEIYLHYTYCDYDVENDTNCRLGFCFKSQK